MHPIILHTRSTDSQLDVANDSKKMAAQSNPSLMSSPFQRTHRINASSPKLSFRSPRSTSTDIQGDMWTIKRCDAFDEGDDSDDEP